MAGAESSLHGFAMASGAPIQVAPLPGVPPFTLAPSAATLAGAPRSAAVGDGWAQGAAVGFPALVPPSAGCDPRTAPTVGGGVGGLGFGGGGPGGDGLLALGESVTMPGWSDVSRSFRSKGGRAREGGGESEKPRGRVCVGWRECGCVVCSCEYLQGIVAGNSCNDSLQGTESSACGCVQVRGRRRPN